MAEWVAVLPILEVCYNETGYEGGVGDGIHGGGKQRPESSCVLC